MRCEGNNGARAEIQSDDEPSAICTHNTAMASIKGGVYGISEVVSTAAVYLVTPNPKKVTELCGLRIYPSADSISADSRVCLKKPKLQMRIIRGYSSSECTAVVSKYRSCCLTQQSCMVVFYDLLDTGSHRGLQRCH